MATKPTTAQITDLAGRRSGLTMLATHRSIWQKLHVTRGEYMLTRRWLLGASLTGSAIGLLGPRAALKGLAAQTDNPLMDVDLDALHGLRGGVSRSFILESANFVDAYSGALLGITIVGMEFKDTDAAAEAIDALVESHPAAIEESAQANGASFDSSRVSIGRLGDERKGISMTVTVAEDDGPDSFAVGLLLVRKKQFLQLTIPFAISRVITPAVEVIQAIDDRWPHNDLWRMVPELDDLPAGMALENEDEFQP